MLFLLIEDSHNFYFLVYHPNFRITAAIVSCVWNKNNNNINLTS